MSMYESFASVYDLFMDNVPYEEWGRSLSDYLKSEGIKDGLILDLGCGTGSLCEYLAGAGYDMIGVDNAPDMLQIALEKRDESGKDILYLCQDMREFELYGTVRAILCVCDSLNYILDEEEVLEVFKQVNNYLDPGGLFIFDMNTLYKYRELLGENTFAENREEGSFIWENFWDEEERINEYDLTLYLREDEGKENFKRFREMHLQRGYEPETIRKLLIRAGLKPEGIYGGPDGSPIKDDSERIWFVAREVTKRP